MSDQRFEYLREALADMPKADIDGRRTVTWVGSKRSLGVCRDGSGRIEVILPGSPWSPSDRALTGLVESGLWTDPDVGSFEATRFVLPAGDHLDAVGAMICVELVRNGIELDRNRALELTEPVIGLALSRLHLGSQALVGLIGELVALRALMLAAPATYAGEIVSSWAGAGRSTRDIQLRNVGIEVKTTTRSSSTHQIQGLAQVELGAGVGGEHETTLFLLSLGIRWLDESATVGDTLPGLVDTITHRLSADSTTFFLDALQTYGGDVGIGYNHERDREKLPYRRPFTLEFERLYDLSDDLIQIPRSHDVGHLAHLDKTSLSFRIELPDSVDGDLNPVVGLQTIAQKALQAASLLTI